MVFIQQRGGILAFGLPHNSSRQTKGDGGVWDQRMGKGKLNFAFNTFLSWPFWHDHPSNSQCLTIIELLYVYIEQPLLLFFFFIHVFCSLPSPSLSSPFASACSNLTIFQDSFHQNCFYFKFRNWILSSGHFKKNYLKDNGGDFINYIHIYRKLL